MICITEYSEVFKKLFPCNLKVQISMPKSPCANPAYKP